MELLVMHRFLFTGALLSAFLLVTSSASANIRNESLGVSLPTNLEIGGDSMLLAGGCYYGGGRPYRAYRPRYPSQSYYFPGYESRGYRGRGNYGGYVPGRYGSGYGRGYGPGYGRGVYGRGGGVGLYIRF